MMDWNIIWIAIKCSLHVYKWLVGDSVLFIDLVPAATGSNLLLTLGAGVGGLIIIHIQTVLYPKPIWMLWQVLMEHFYSVLCINGIYYLIDIYNQAWPFHQKKW